MSPAGRAGPAEDADAATARRYLADLQRRLLRGELEAVVAGAGAAARPASLRALPVAALLTRVAAGAQRGHPEAALALLERALEHDPGNLEARVLSGSLLDRTGQHAAAAERMLQVLRTPDAPPAAVLRAAYLLARFDRGDVALVAARRAFAALGDPLVWAAPLLYVAQRGADWELADRLTRQLRDAHAAGQTAAARESPRTHLNWCADESLNLRVLQAYRARALPEPAREPPPVPEPLEGRRLRLGYLSSDFRDHPTARLLLGLLRHHDRSRFEIRLYCSGWDDGSALRAELEAHADAVHSVTGLGDAAAAHLIREHCVDVLLDLNGPTRAHRLGILAARPAPVQISYLAWPGSLGGGVVDYVVADPYTLPDTRDRLYPEAILRLDPIYQVNDYAARTPPARPARARLGLPRGTQPIVGMFNGIEKVSSAVWAAWMQILRAVPDALLWILDPGPAAARRIARVTAAHGVDLDRVIRAPRKPQSEHLERLAGCDLMLDPWPYGGHTSTSDALFAGVPVVALEGCNFASRVSGGLLHAAGLPEFVQPDVDRYVRFAAQLLRDPAALERARERVRTQVPGSPLFDAEQRARQLEAACHQALEQQSAGRPPERIDAAAPTPAPTPPPSSASGPPTAPGPAIPVTPVWVLDPGLNRQAGHHRPLDEALLAYARQDSAPWTFFVHREAPEDFPAQRCLSAGAYVTDPDWLGWLSRTTRMAARFAADLQRVLTPRLARSAPPRLILPSTTLPLVMGMARWLESFAPRLPVASLGLHFHTPPDFGWPGSSLPDRLASEALGRLTALSDAHALDCRVTLEHAGLAPAWVATGAPNPRVAPSPHAWIRATRQRAFDERLRLLFIGPPREEKGINHLLAAWPRLQEHLPQLDLRLVCSTDRPDLHTQLLALGSDRVTVEVFPNIPAQRFYQEIADADALFCAYVPEHYACKSSGIFQEAQALGVPALVTAGTAAEQDLRAASGRGGVVTPDLEPDSLLRACASLAECLPRLRAEARAVAPDYAENRSGAAWLALHLGATDRSTVPAGT